MNTKKNIIKNLNLLQKKFLIKNSQDYILANESINIIKGHPTFFEIFEKYSICKYLKLIVKYSLRNLYILLNSLIYYKPQFQKKKILDCLLVSHFISQKKKNLNKHKDTYFGEFEKNKNFKNLNSLKILINHTKNYKHGYNSNRIIILQNYASFKYSIIIIANLYYLFLKYFFFSLKNKKFISYLIKVIALEFINPQTFKNLILKKNFEDVIFGKQIKKVFLTYEGYAWERFLCQVIKKNSKSSEIFAYQFGILIKNQYSMFNEFPSIYLPHKIITSGINNYKILKKFFSNVSIIGSSRSIKNSNRILKKNNTCLVLPEGIDSECIILLNFVINLAFKMPEINFIFRLHPLTNVTKIKKMLKKNAKQFNFDNIEISAKSLSFDLNRSSVCLYRGSTSSIAAVQSGLMPIYYNYRSDFNIDPMFQINKKMRYVKNLEDFKIILNMKKQKKELILKKIIKLANNYFVKFDHKILNKILSY